MRLLVAIVLLTTSFCGGWQLRAIQAQRDVLAMQAKQARQLAAAQQRARQREQVLQQKMQVLQHETERQLAEIRDIERAAADSRVRKLAQNYAAGHRTSADSSAPTHCQTERNRAAVLADLFAELDELAQQFAATADRNRITGKACEAAYTAIYQTLP